MAKLTATKNDIYQEDVDYKSAVSEFMLSKIGQSINFINDKQMCVYDFKFLGKFYKISGGEDGAMVLPFDIEICGISWRLRSCGDSGTTILDLHKVNSSGVDQGSLLTYGWYIPHNELDNAGFFKNYISGTSNDMAETGNIMPIIPDADRLLSAGESLRIDVEGNATNAQDLAIHLFYRPR